MSFHRRWPWAATLIVLAGALVATRALGRRRDGGTPYVAARAVVDRHCVGCHSEQPTVAAFRIAAGGLVLDTAEQLQRYAGRIKVRVLEQRNMPLLNKTAMTDDERALLGAWVDAG